MEESNVFSGKTVEEAIEEGLKELDLTREEVDIEVLEEGKKKIFGAVKAKVKLTKKPSDGERAVEFIEGLLDLLGINAVTEIVSDGEKLEINITSTDSNKVIGRHGEVLDAVQCLAGAVSNIGRDVYKKVVVDCENYREGREKTLVDLANRLAAKAVAKQRRVTLEPMNPYERRVIHSTLANSEEVKTISSGKEPARFVVIIPNNEKPHEGRDRHERGGRFERRERGGRRDNRSRDRRERSGGGRSSGGAARGKKEIHFGTFLGNSGAGGNGGENNEE